MSIGWFFLVRPWIKCFNDSLVEWLKGIPWSSAIITKSPRVKPCAWRMHRTISIQARWSNLGGVLLKGTSTMSSLWHAWQRYFLVPSGVWVEGNIDTEDGVGGGVEWSLLTERFFLFDEGWLGYSRGTNGALAIDSPHTFSWMCLVSEWHSSRVFHFLGPFPGVDGKTKGGSVGTVINEFIGFLNLDTELWCVNTNKQFLSEVSRGRCVWIAYVSL